MKVLGAHSDLLCHEQPHHTKPQAKRLPTIFEDRSRRDAILEAATLASANSICHLPGLMTAAL